MYFPAFLISGSISMQMCSPAHGFGLHAAYFPQRHICSVTKLKTAESLSLYKFPTLKVLTDR